MMGVGMIIKKIFIFFIRFYKKFLSPLLGSHCRFYPNCSSYAEEAIAQKGLLSGGWLSMKRMLKCQPFHPGGIDFLEQSK
jgi:hypothetical protein